LHVKYQDFANRFLDILKLEKHLGANLARRWCWCQTCLAEIIISFQCPIARYNSGNQVGLYPRFIFGGIVSTDPRKGTPMINGIVFVVVIIYYISRTKPIPSPSKFLGIGPPLMIEITHGHASISIQSWRKA
jgi:hypothetical protein